MTVFINNLKTVGLLGGMMGLLAVIGGMLGEGYLLPFLIGGLIMNVGAWFFSDTIAIKAMRGRELTRENGGDLYRMVEELATRANLPMPKVYLCPHQAPNAFATGRSPRKAAVAFTQGCVELLTPDELAGVAAHELAHIKNRDTLTSCIAATIAGVLAFMAQWGFMFFGGNRSQNPLVMIVVIIIAAVGAALIKAAISRSREFVADADGAEIAGSPDGLMSALRKLEAYSRQIPLVQPNPAQNNLFIVEPFAGGGLTNLFATHPPTERRLASLSKLR
ncbi:MAG: M48 family metalloprotease [Planctomycetota bacterium]